MRTLLELYPGDHIALLAANVLVQVTVVMLLTWAVARCVARRGAAARHDVWLCALLGLLLSPAIACTLNRAGVSIISLPFLPAEQVEQTAVVEESVPDQEPSVFATPYIDDIAAAPQPAWESLWEPPISETELAHTAFVLEVPETAEVEAATSPPPTPLSRADKLRALVGAVAAMWVVGVLVLLARTIHGWRILARLRRETRPLGTGKLDQIAEQVRHTLGIKRLPRIVVAPNLGSPITVGIIRPLLILPKQLTRTLRRDQLRDVLLHECAHVARRDHLVGMLQLLAEMLFWPHPLVHVMNRQLARSREEVCDNYVLRHGDGPRYAQTLLELSRKLVPTTARFAALGLCHPRWRLEDRIGGLLDKRRGTMTRMNTCLRGLMVCVLLTAATLVAGTRIVAAQLKEPPALDNPPAETKKKPTEKESAGRDKLSKGKAKPLVPVARPVDADAREQFLEIERIARLSAKEQAKQLPHLYGDLAPRYMNPFVEAIISSRRRNILDPKSIGSGDTSKTYSEQLADATGEKSPEEVADAIKSGMWLNVAAKERALWVFGRHPEALDKLLEADLDSGDKSSVRRAACTIGALKRTSLSGKLLQMYLADDEMSKVVWAPLLFTDHSDIFEPLLRKVEKDPRLLIRCAGLLRGPLHGKPANPMLLELVSSADKQISYHAAYALYECKDAKLAPLAAKFAKDPTPRFRVIAAYWASNMPRDAFKSIREELLPLLADTNEKVRSAALRCFSQQKDLGGRAEPSRPDENRED